MPTREEILAAAEQVIRERGVTGATTRHIARVAGCSEGSLYNHFANKQELIAHAVRERMAQFPQRARELAELAGTGEVVTNLTELAELAIAFHRTMAPMMAAMMADAASMQRRAEAIDQAGHGPRRTLQAVVDYLRAEQTLGRVRPGAHLEGAAMALVGACFQQALLAQVWGEQLVLLDDRSAAREIVRAIVDGL